MSPVLSLCLTYCIHDYHLLDRLLKRLMLQTVAPSEIIIVSSGIREQDIISHPQLVINGYPVPVTMVNSPQLMNAAAARNLGAATAKGDIVQFFDGDDLPHPQRTEITLKCFEHSGCDALFHAWSPAVQVLEHEVEFDSSRLYKCVWADHDQVIAPGASHPIACGPIALRQSVREQVSYRTHLMRREDAQFAREIIESGKYKTLLYDEPLMYYVPSSKQRRRSRPEPEYSIATDLSKPFPYC